jgi:hypothetical protein
MKSFAALITSAALCVAGCQTNTSLPTAPATQPTLLTPELGLALEQAALSFWEGEFAKLQTEGKLSGTQVAAINALDTAAQAAITKASADITAGGTVSQADNDAMVAAIGALAQALPSL